MKISKLFHWLYCLVMFLPVLFIPIMAIYSHRHEINDYSIQVQETKVVDFNQNIKNGDFDDGTTYWSFSGGTINIDNNYLVFTPNDQYGYVSQSLDFSVTYQDIYYLSVNFNSFYTFSYNDISLVLNNGINEVGIREFSNGLNETLVTINTEGLNRNTILYFYNNVSDNFRSFSFTNVMLINLTQMFGSGNEPSLQQFKSWYYADYYSFTLSHRELLKTGNYITYDDTDIGSQFVYDTYNVVDKYFNYDKVFNFGDLYGWLQITFFSGNDPLGFFIFWHLLIYWLLTSILWLIFDVLMYVPQLVHRWLDKASLS